jgi:AcrR family transcriptional regulator
MIVVMTDTQRKIYATALELADEGGLAAVSMRKVAQRLGMSHMSLYPHITSKQALLDGMLDLLLGEHYSLLGQQQARAGWWPRLVAIGQGVRALARRHPNAFPLLLARPSVTPDALRATDALFQVLLDAGVPGAQVPRLERLVATFMLGFAASEVSGRFGPGTLTQRARRAQLSPEEIPAHYRLAEHLDQDTDWDAEFDADLKDLRTLIEAVARSGT